jgi:hypothetical protein
MATVTAVPPTLDIQLYAGDDVVITLTITTDGAPYDLTGILLSEIRKAHGAEVVTVFTANAPDPNSGVCYLSLTGDETTLLGADGGRHSWDLQLTNPMGLVSTLARGGVTTQLDITESGP